MPKIDFWFSIGSTYTYLAAMRAEDVARQCGVELTWHPFSVRRIIDEVGNRPFTGKPTKMAYMWRDIERRAGRYGLPINVPAPYPVAGAPLANQVAVIGESEGWCATYVQETYRRWFQQGLEPGIEPNLSESLKNAGQDSDRVLALARGAVGESGLEANTNAARALGIFGAPTFVVDRELFWGDDRLEDAVEWAIHGRLIGD